MLFRIPVLLGVGVVTLTTDRASPETVPQGTPDINAPENRVASCIAPFDT